MEEIIKETKSGSKIHLYNYNDVKNPKAAILIVHGASEHFGRYHDFAKFLIKNDYNVIGFDILGHGKSAETYDYIYFKNNEADESVALALDFLKDTYPKTQHFLLGHSMGSFIARKILIDYKDDFSKAIISGTTYMGGFITSFGMFICNILKLFHNDLYISKFLSNISMDSMPNKMLKDHMINSKDEWITHDEKIVKYYKEAKDCGQPFTVNAYKQMYKWINYVCKKKNIKKANLNTPLLFINGLDDALSNYGNDVRKLVKIFYNIGYKDISHIEYANMRHEVLNEIDNEKVYQDIINFLVK